MNILPVSKHIVNTACRLALLCAIANPANASTDERYVVTGVEFFSEIIAQGYELRLLQITDETTSLKIPLHNNTHLCRLTRSGELSLMAGKQPFRSISCKLSAFSSSDRLKRGWEIDHMQWRGDHRQTTIHTEPNDTDRPHFSLELTHHANDNPLKKTKRIRLLVVTLSGPQGNSWKMAFDQQL